MKIKAYDNNLSQVDRVRLVKIITTRINLQKEVSTLQVSLLID